MTCKLGLGCTEAINLDGGGSSSLFLKDKIINSPCKDEDQKGGSNERKLSNALIVREKK
ncbi:MAG: phosphodiester glycosidase family protein [Chlamydiae bacterium]|nr:phosphodiester glycosidase family protein [Chlamydiota bacterium]